MQPDLFHGSAKGNADGSQSSLELLYLAGHPRPKLEQALRIPALCLGWRNSLHALLEQELSGGSATGNPGLTSAGGPPPAWPGFRRLRVSRIARESDTVFSVELVSDDNRPLAAAYLSNYKIARLIDNASDTCQGRSVG